MAYRFKTGVFGLDEVIEGGFPAHSAIAIVGEPGCGKSIFCQQFIWEGLKRGAQAYYLTIDHSPQDLRETMLRFGWDINQYEKTGQFAFIDGFLPALGIKSKEKWEIQDPYQPDNIIRTIELAKLELPEDVRIGKREIRFAFDSFSSITRDLDLIPLYRFGRRLQKYTRQLLNVGLFVIHKGFHNSMVETAVRQYVDGVIDLERRRVSEHFKRFLCINKMKLTKSEDRVLPFKITDQGIVISAKNFVK